MGKVYRNCVGDRVMESQSKDTHTFLWNDVIRKVLYYISESGLNYCINDPQNVRQSIYNKIDEYVEMTKQSMCKNGEDINNIHIDRHKFASCVCGAIIAVRPIGRVGKQWVRNANEIVALQAGTIILQRNVIYDFIEAKNVSEEDKVPMTQFFKEKFKLNFPSKDENLCEKKDYVEGLCADLSKTYHYCKHKNATCFHYDVFAYSKIFYHIEMKNREQLNDIYQSYMNSKNTSVSQ